MSGRNSLIERAKRLLEGKGDWGTIYEIKTPNEEAVSDVESDIYEFLRNDDYDLPPKASTHIKNADFALEQIFDILRGNLSPRKHGMPEGVYVRAEKFERKLDKAKEILRRENRDDELKRLNEISRKFFDWYDDWKESMEKTMNTPSHKRWGP